jgi:hypothetical protein
MRVSDFFAANAGTAETHRFASFSLRVPRLGRVSCSAIARLGNCVGGALIISIIASRLKAGTLRADKRLG